MITSQLNKIKAFTKLDLSLFGILLTLFVLVIAGFIAK
jgi:hypothetical protein